MKNQTIIIRNMTPHDVRFLDSDNNTIVVFPTEGLIRLSEERKKVMELELQDNESLITLPIFIKEFGDAELPPKEKGTYYIVSLPVAQAFPERDDFIVPDNMVRDENGRPIGCKAFATLSEKLKKKAVEE